MDTKTVTREVRCQQWAQIIREHKGSGQTVRAFCAQHGINEKSYYYWQRKLREEICEKLALNETPVNLMPQTSFAQINLPACENSDASGINMQLNGAQLHIGGDTPVELAECVLRIFLEKC